MLGNHEKRRFQSGEKVWFGSYQNLANVLHWHFECELIRVTTGSAQIKIGNVCFDALEGDCFFCQGEEVHCITSTHGSLVDVMIFDESIAKDITDNYVLLSPKITDTATVKAGFDRINTVLQNKGEFYREALSNYARGMIIDIFRSSKVIRQNDKSKFYKNLISKINEEFSFITFEDAVHYSGYSNAHFSKVFKKLSGMNFSEYLNIIKVENAISMIHSGENITMTAVSLKCGFSTVRNFNRVFKNITGYSPRTLPEDYIMDAGMRITKEKDFDPTNKNSMLM